MSDGLQTTPLFDVSGVARLIADASCPEDLACSQTRRFNQKGYIPAVAHRGTGSNRANLYGPAEVAGIKLLSVLTDLGIDDLGSASKALYEWDRYQPKVTGAPPILAAMMYALRGDHWTYQLRLLRNDQTGAREVQAWISDPDRWVSPPEHPSTGMQPRAAVTVHLKPLLLPLYYRIAASIVAADPVTVA